MERRTTSRAGARRRSSRYTRPKRKQKTRNVMLFVVCLFVIAYTVIEVVMGFVSMKQGMAVQLDSTLTSEVFSFAKWVVISGATITVAKTAKGTTNSDEDEFKEDEGNG